MKTRNILLSILMLAIGLSAFSQTNLVLNGDMETLGAGGDHTFENWGTSDAGNLRQEITNFINGARSVRLAGVNNKVNINQTITDLEAGATYILTLSGRIMDAAGASGSAANTNHVLNAFIFNENAATKWDAVVVITSNTDTTMTGSYVVPAGESSVKIVIDKNNGIAYIDDVSFVKDEVTAIASNATVNALKAYSPYAGAIRITADKAISNYAVFSVDGKLIKRAQTNANEITIDANEKGIYILRATVNGSPYTQKVLVK